MEEDNLSYQNYKSRAAWFVMRILSTAAQKGQM